MHIPASVLELKSGDAIQDLEDIHCTYKVLAEDYIASGHIRVALKCGMCSYLPEGTASLWFITAGTDLSSLPSGLEGKTGLPWPASPPGVGTVSRPCLIPSVCLLAEGVNSISQ